MKKLFIRLNNNISLRVYLVDVLLVFKITKCIIYVALILIKCTVLGIIII